MVVHTHSPSPGRLGLENGKFEASVNYIVELCLKKKEKRKVSSLNEKRTEYNFNIKMRSFITV